MCIGEGNLIFYIFKIFVSIKLKAKVYEQSTKLWRLKSLNIAQPQILNHAGVVHCIFPTLIAVVHTLHLG